MLMSFRPISRPEGISDLPEKFQRWLWQVQGLLTLTKTYTATINPVSVPANSTSEQEFTVTGVNTNDILTVNKPTHTAGLIIGNVRASASDTVAITFGNITGSAIDPIEETYIFKITRT